MTGFRHLGDTEVARLHRLRVVRGDFEAPDGERFTRDVIRNQAVVAIVPLLEDGRTVLTVRQYRGPIDDLLLEIPAGLCDVDGEEPLATAARELAEEIGYEAARFEHLAGFHPAAGFCDQFVDIYMATGLREVGARPEGPEERHMTTERVDLDDFDGLVADGRLTDAKTIIGLFVARDRLRRAER